MSYRKRCSDNISYEPTHKKKRLLTHKRTCHLQSTTLKLNNEREMSCVDEHVQQTKDNMSVPSVALANVSGVDGGHPRVYTQAEVTALMQNQEQIFRTILEEKLREQFNLFNQMYIDNIFKEYKNADLSYIN